MGPRHRIRWILALAVIPLLDVAACEDTLGPEGEFSPRLDRSTRPGGMAFYPRTFSGATVDLAPTTDGFIDANTGSLFSVDGQGRDGPLADTELVPVRDAYVAFWGAWAAFQPVTELWLPAGSRDGES